MAGGVVGGAVGFAYGLTQGAPISGASSGARSGYDMAEKGIDYLKEDIIRPEDKATDLDATGKNKTQANGGSDGQNGSDNKGETVEEAMSRQQRDESKNGVTTDGVTTDGDGG